MSKFFLKISLTILIGLSFYLSFFIWTNNGNYNRSPVISNKNMAQVDYSRNLSNLYAPIKVFNVDYDGEKTILSGQINKITLEVKKSLKNVDLRKMMYGEDSEKGYDSILNFRDSIQLFYQSPLSIKILSQMFNFKFDKIISNFPCNRIVIVRISPIEDRILFLNDITNKYYYINEKIKLEKIFSIASNTKNKISVKEQRGSNGFFTIFQNQLPLKSYSYLIKTLDDSYFVSSFMTNDGSAGLTFDSKTNTYKKGLTKTLEINEKTGIVHFLDHHIDEKEIPNDLTSLLNRGRQVMQVIGNSFNSFRYFSNPSYNRIVFRSYIDGFPVFFDEKKGNISLSWGGNSQSFYFANSTLEVPISSSQNSRILEPTNDLIEKLNQKGISAKDIQDIQIGYSWVKNSDTTEVVNLLPQYFVKIKGIYREASSLISHNPGEGK